jgi:hypothetical protein
MITGGLPSSAEAGKRKAHSRDHANIRPRMRWKIQHSLWASITLLVVGALAAFGQEDLPAIAPIAAIDYEAIRLTRIVTAVRSQEKSTVDGHLDEPAWKLAMPATDFITLLPRPEEPSSERTEVRFVYDDNNLYVGFIASTRIRKTTSLY